VVLPRHGQTSANTPPSRVIVRAPRRVCRLVSVWPRADGVIPHGRVRSFFFFAHVRARTFAALADLIWKPYMAGSYSIKIRVHAQVLLCTVLIGSSFPAERWTRMRSRLVIEVRTH